MKIKLLITGGTIDKSYNMHNGELHFVDSHIPAMLAEGRCKADVEFDKLMLKDSLDITENDRYRFCRVVNKVKHQKLS